MGTVLDLIGPMAHNAVPCSTLPRKSFMSRPSQFSVNRTFLFSTAFLVSVFTANLAAAQPGPPAEFQKSFSAESINKADVSVLFIGNSHSHPIPDLLGRVFKANDPGKKVVFAVASGYGFLVDHARNKRTLDLLKKGKWDFVVLQAQKYSTTGRRTYPIDGALKLSEIAKKHGTKVIMYPEWSRRNVPEEYKRINKLHHRIAKKTKATVAPIGQTWAAVLKKNPKLILHSSDGNHASVAGSYLNACLFYGMLTDKKVTKASKLPRVKLSPSAFGLIHKSCHQSLVKEGLIRSEKPELESGSTKKK